MALKPMNCPGHCAFYAMGKHSYRELPIRYAEPGLLHRNEPSGTLHGLLRVRHFIQDDAHIFCTEEQVEDEVLDCLEFGFAWYDQFGFDMRVELSTRPENRIGTDEMWDRAEAALAGGARATAATSTTINEGDGAFYGPKIDLHMTRLARPLVAARHRAARLQPARALRPDLHGRRQRRAPAGDDPPRAASARSSASSGSCSSTPPASCRSGSRRCRPPCCRSPTATTTTRSEVAAALRGRRPARRGRRAHRVGRAQDPRRRAAQGALHARRRRPRGRGRRGRRCAATARATSGTLPLDEAVERDRRTGGAPSCGADADALAQTPALRGYTARR